VSFRKEPLAKSKQVQEKARAKIRKNHCTGPFKNHQRASAQKAVQAEREDFLSTN